MRLAVTCCGSAARKSCRGVQQDLARARQDTAPHSPVLPALAAIMGMGYELLIKVAHTKATMHFLLSELNMCKLFNEEGNFLHMDKTLGTGMVSHFANSYNVQVV